MYPEKYLIHVTKTPNYMKILLKLSFTSKFENGFIFTSPYIFQCLGDYRIIYCLKTPALISNNYLFYKKSRLN